MKFEIDDDLVQKIVVSELKRDFIYQQEDIARLLSKSKPLAPYEQEDLWMHKEVGDALAIVLRYYMYRPDADEFIKENSAT